jgi:hypothetical protein
LTPGDEFAHQVDALRQMSAPLDSGGEPPDDGRMEARIAHLETFAADAKERLVKIETRLDQTATKSDLLEMSTSLVKWVVGSALGLGVSAITVTTFVLNNAAPKTAPAAPAPIIIYAQPAPAIPLSALPPAPPAKQ